MPGCRAGHPARHMLTVLNAAPNPQVLGIESVSVAQPPKDTGTVLGVIERDPVNYFRCGACKGSTPGCRRLPALLLHGLDATRCLRAVTAKLRLFHVMAHVARASRGCVLAVH